MGLSFDQPSPDQSTFSRFRNRLSKKAMSEINHEVLMQFTAKGLTINEGIAIDARLGKSASHPLSTEKREEAKAKSETPQGKVDKNGKPLKCSRDLESDWVMKNNVVHFGLSHLYNNAFRARFTLSPNRSGVGHFSQFPLLNYLNLKTVF